MIKKHFALLAICLFFIAIITSACGGSGKTTPPSYPFIPVPTPEKFPLELSQAKFTLNVGDTDNITVTLNGEDITQTATYTVDQEAVVNVEGGLITGLSAGLAIVTVNAENAEEEKTFTVNVIDPSLPTLEVSPTELNLSIEEEATVTVTLEGEDVTEQVTYTSDDESIATAEKGKITAQYNGGTAKISVSKEGANSATITINVTDDSEEVTLGADVLNKLGYKKVQNEESYYDIKTIEDDTLITNLEIPAIFKDNEGNKYKITGIGQSAFYTCTSLKNVTIPDSVTTIGEKAFTYCPSLEKVTIPNSVTIIGKYAFNTCTSLENVTIGNSVTTIGQGAFYYCTSLKNVTIPNSVTTIGYAAFTWCNSLENVTIGNSVTTIGQSAFYECGYYQGTSESSKTAHLTLKIPDQVETIGNNAFYKVKCISYTNNLQALPYPNDNPNWGAEDHKIIEN